MEDYITSNEYKRKKKLLKALKFVMFLRILSALVIVSSLFIAIWGGGWLLSLRVLLTGLASGLLLWGFYNAFEKHIYTIK